MRDDCLFPLVLILLAAVRTTLFVRAPLRSETGDGNTGQRLAASVLTPPVQGTGSGLADDATVSLNQPQEYFKG